MTFEILFPIFVLLLGVGTGFMYYRREHKKRKELIKEIRKRKRTVRIKDK